MPHICELHVMGRVILLPAVNNPETVDALDWLLENIYKKGDAIHILSIVPYVDTHAQLTCMHHHDQVCSSGVLWCDATTLSRRCRPKG